MALPCLTGGIKLLISCTLRAAYFLLNVLIIRGDIIEDLYLTSPIPPSVNHYLGYRVVKKGKYSMAVSYRTKETKDYSKAFTQYVADEVKKQGWDLVPNDTQHFYIETTYYFPAKGMDGNNYFKVMLDAITDTQLVWLDDDVTCERVNAIYYDANNPRVELHIHPVDYIGIFDNKNQLDDFVSVCVGCNRYARNCSILRKAKEGRIQEEISDMKCSKYKERKDKRTKKEKKNGN